MVEVHDDHVRELKNQALYRAVVNCVDAETCPRQKPEVHPGIRPPTLAGKLSKSVFANARTSIDTIENVVAEAVEKHGDLVSYRGRDGRNWIATPRAATFEWVFESEACDFYVDGVTVAACKKAIGEANGSDAYDVSFIEDVVGLKQEVSGA